MPERQERSACRRDRQWLRKRPGHLNEIPPFRFLTSRRVSALCRPNSSNRRLSLSRFPSADLKAQVACQQEAEARSFRTPGVQHPPRETRIAFLQRENATGLNAD